MKKKEMKHKHKYNGSNVRGQLLPLNSSKRSETMHKIQLGNENNQHRSNELREMPQNYFWVSSNTMQKGQKFFCKQCQRGFKSPRAVFGHMRCHSSRRTNTIVQRCTVNDEVKLFNTPRKKRSVGRYKINTSCPTNSSWCNMNTSSSVNDFDEELQDIAASLLMLANGGFHSVDHVSDNDSVMMEPKFPKCGSGMESVNANNHDHGTKGILVAELGSDFDVLKCGCDSFNEKNKEFHCGFLKNKPENFKYGPVFDIELQSDICDSEMKDLNPADSLFDNVNSSTSAPIAEEMKYKTIDAADRVFDGPKSTSKTGPTVRIEHEAELFDAETNDETSGVSVVDTTVNSSSRKSCVPVVEESKHESTGVADEAFDKCNSEINGLTIDNPCLNQCQKYTCSICKKSFMSHQALGGHRLHCPVQKRLYQVQSNKKTWRHKCLVCCKAFSSGQALGGHMRAHFNANVLSNKMEYVSCGKENLADIEEERKESNDDHDTSIRAAVIELRKQENEACSNKIQQLLKEKEMVITPQVNIPLFV